MATIFLNGRFVEPGQATVSALDAGLQHAVGLFETMLGGKQPGVAEPDDVWVFRLADHMDRLASSAEALGLSTSLNTVALGDAVMETVRRAGHERARIRLTITAGDMSGGPSRTPTVLIVAQPATAYPDAMFDRGVAAVIADARANPLGPLEGHKTLNYWWRLRELQTAAAKDAAEAIVLQVTNHLAGGCVSNIFLVKDGELLTPIARGEESEIASRGTASAAEEGDEPMSLDDPIPAPAASPPAHQHRGAVLASPVLPGITRAWVRERADILDIPLSRRMLSITDLLAADEVFLTNSSWGVLPIVRVERESIAAGNVGPITRRLREAWLDATAS